jgi:hypothetical protein
MNKETHLSNYKKPWRVHYRQVCDEWHPQSSPCIVDQQGRLVVNMPQTVDHPGLYDELADNTAKEIVAAVNAQYGAYGL